MSESIISINLENTITIGLMVLIAFFVASFVAAQFAGHNKGG